MLRKIKIILGVFILYLLGYRAYTVYAKWTTFDNKIMPFDTVFLKKDADIHSNAVIAEAVNQVNFFDIFKNTYIFDHLEPSSMQNYLDNVLILN